MAVSQRCRSHFVLSTKFFASVSLSVGMMSRILLTSLSRCFVSAPGAGDGAEGEPDARGAGAVEGAPDVGFRPLPPPPGPRPPVDIAPSPRSLATPRRGSAVFATSTL